MTVTPRPPVRSDQENRIQEFFQIQTVTQWTEFFKSELWDRYVLQLSLREPCLHHAKLALGAMHRFLSTDMSTTEYEHFAIQQHNKAISHVVRPLKPLSPIVVLIACWMFSCYDVMRGDHESLSRHLASGLQLISSLGPTGHFGKNALGQGPNDDEENKIIWECLVQQFSLLDLQMTMYEPDWITSSLEHCQGPNEPIAFRSIEEARQRLTALLLRTMELKRREVRQSVDKVLESEVLSPERKNVLDGLDQWSAAFESFFDCRRRQLTEEHTRAAQLLQIQQLAAYIHLSVTALDEDTKYDTYLPKFRRIVSLSHALLTPSETSLSKHPKMKKFLYEHGVIPSLYLTGYKCRDPIVRRDAHGLLASIRRKEGVWDSDLMAKVVKHIIEVEETNLVVRTSTDIPREARVWREFIEAGQDAKQPKVLFELRLDHGDGTRVVERKLD